MIINFKPYLLSLEQLRLQGNHDRGEQELKSPPRKRYRQEGEKTKLDVYSDCQFGSSLNLSLLQMEASHLVLAIALAFSTKAPVL